VIKFFAGLFVGMGLGALALIGQGEWVGMNGQHFKIVRTK
jgi:hypothetical protein